MAAVATTDRTTRRAKWCHPTASSTNASSAAAMCTRYPAPPSISLSGTCHASRRDSRPSGYAAAAGAGSATIRVPCRNAPPPPAMTCIDRPTDAPLVLVQVAALVEDAVSLERQVAGRQHLLPVLPGLAERDRRVGGREPDRMPTVRRRRGGRGSSCAAGSRAARAGGRRPRGRDPARGGAPRSSTPAPARSRRASAGGDGRRPVPRQNARIAFAASEIIRTMPPSSSRCSWRATRPTPRPWRAW